MPANPILLGLAFTVATAAGPDPATVLRAVAADIEALGATRPPLAGFRAGEHFDAARPSIDYAFHTHAATQPGGWTAGVPNPDADGLWFHIDVHDPASTAQIHTQPMVEPLCLGRRRVSFLVLEGADAGAVGGELRAILGRHGVSRCPVTPSVPSRPKG